MADDRTAIEIAEAERKAAADTLNAQREAEKKRLETEILQADLERKRAEFGEWQQSQAQRDAEASAKLKALELANDTSERAALQALVPDLTKVDRGSLTAPDSSTVFGALLGSKALDDAAAKLIPVVEGALGKGFKVLVTNDLDLATKDAGYRSAVEGLAHLSRLIEQFRRPVKALEPLTSAAVVAAGLLPGLLSLVSARRSLATSSGSVDDQVALVTVAGKLAGQDTNTVVLVDQARLAGEDSEALRSWTVLRVACDELAVALETEADQHDKAWADEGASLLKSGRAALSAMVTTDGKEPSALAKAALQEVLHSDAVHAVLVVKGGATSGTQLVNDRPLLFEDKLSVVSTATIAYLLVDHHAGCKVLRGGLAIGKAQFSGTVGSTLPLH